MINFLCLNLYAGRHNGFNSLFIDAAKYAKPSVVSIIISQRLEKNGKRYLSKVGYGSGTIISKNGYVITNYHVLKKGNFFQVILYDGTECEILKLSHDKYYIADEKTDLALLKIEDVENISITPIVFEDSSNLLEGEWVLAIGSPFGLRQSITSGIVSSKGRNDIGFADIEDFIQTDVPINPGNSGGPLVNLYGKLVGINTAIRTISGGYQGISFAIPSNIVEQVCHELIKYGRVRRGWLGFLARDRRIHNTHGNGFVEVISVIRGSPADMAGICKGDIVKEVDGDRILNIAELIKAVGNKPVGAKLKITTSRDGELYDFCLILREKSIHQNIQRRLKRLFSIYGIELDENAKTGDVVVSYLSPMGIAYQNGLKRGDSVISLNKIDVSTLEKFVNVFYKSRCRIIQMAIYRDSRLYKIEFINNLGSDMLN
ncbi:MAG: trypsin-like peptidase domain-containing protein [Spirochaetota bacterium]|nr:trypsin-like peptidase domain-containing protein [Spirochaetota bacterium]